MFVFLFCFLLLSQHEVVKPIDRDSVIAGIIVACIVGSGLRGYLKRSDEIKKRYLSHCMTPTDSNEGNVKVTYEFFYKNIDSSSKSPESVNCNTEKILRKIAKGTLSRGDYIVISNADQKWPHIPSTECVQKRLIGLPGDTIEGDLEARMPVVYLNGKLLQEPYVNKIKNVLVFNQKTKEYEWKVYHPDLLKDEPYLIIEKICPRRKILSYGPDGYRYVGCYDDMQSVFFKVTLGPDEVFIMGDNRVNSYDSRHVGPIKIKHIVGKYTAERIHKEYYTEYYEDLIRKERQRYEERKKNPTDPFLRLMNFIKKVISYEAWPPVGF